MAKKKPATPKTVILYAKTGDVKYDDLWISPKPESVEVVCPNGHTCELCSDQASNEGEYLCHEAAVMLGGLKVKTQYRLTIKIEEMK